MWQLLRSHPRKAKSPPESVDTDNMRLWASINPCFAVLIALAAATSGGLRDARAEDPRVVHRFDFSEPENLDSIPMYWLRFPDPSLPIYPDPDLPRYTEALRDDQVGHDAAPSFRLDAQGRNIAFRYTGPDTDVTPGDYLVTGWIRGRNLQYARACISVYYLDFERRPLPETQRFGELIGGEGGDDWQQVRILLPPADRTVHGVGITCWVVQQSIWREGQTPHRHIAYRDPDAGAWFDDIVIYRIPRVQLATAWPGNVIPPGEQPRLELLASDQLISGESTRLTVSDLDGRVVFETTAPIRPVGDTKPQEILLPMLPTGLYRADLMVGEADSEVTGESIRFAVLGMATGSGAARWGVVIDAPSGEQALDVASLITGLGVGVVKLPFWGQSPAMPGFEAHPDMLHELLNVLTEERIRVVGVLAGPPLSLVQNVGPYARTLLEILTDNPEGWADVFAGAVAPYASIFLSWQIGSDDNTLLAEDARYAESFEPVRQALSTVDTAPNLSAVAFAGVTPPDRIPEAQRLALTVPDDIRPEFIEAHVAPFKERGYEHVGLTIAEPRIGPMRDESLTQWAIRLLEARWSDVDTLFVPQLWQTRQALFQTVTEPTIGYPIYRNIVMQLGDASPAFRFKLDDMAMVLVFGDGRRAVVAMWDPQAPPEGREYTLQLGREPEFHDLWGQPLEIPQTDDGRFRLTLTRSPIFVREVPRWLMSFRAALRIDPEHADFSFSRQEHSLVVANPHREALTGIVEITPPEGWEMDSDEVRFALQPGEMRRFPMLLRHPQNESAGLKSFDAHVKLKTGGMYVFDVDIPLTLGLPDVDVWGYTFLDGDRLIIRQGITNLSNQSLSFRGFAVYPGRSRQYRVINEVLAGQTLTTEYVFNGVGNASGKTVRVSLREVNGPRIHNLDIVVP